ncbi:hypothetical protein [Melghirimyces algeriensis]|uniref:YtpI-like protein n=1 Tax=Melghirimyces algeriensis TaxID=910412 RepID=A0A521AEI6_9BACL|nr:hypothetical protein [Melghirimyces algeriensis]SMO33224.1 YtpI-like protein [Melghirimyces algeriensis]
MQILMLLFVVIILITGIRTFSSSTASHRTEGMERIKHRATMNINMGIMFITLALMQGIAINESWISMILLIGIGAVGIYNVIFGVRTRRFLREQMKH